MNVPVVTHIMAHCVTCLEPVDLTGPHAIGSHGYYHRQCFDKSHPQMLTALQAQTHLYADRIERLRVSSMDAT